MLIVSTFKDYYDRAIGYGGIDKSIVYNRETMYPNYIDEKQYFGKYFPKSHSTRWLNFEQFTLTPFIIGFCGKIYSGYVFQYENRKKNVNVDFRSYDIADLEPYVHLFYDKKIPSDFQQFMGFSGIENSDLFIRYNVPIFYVSGSENSYNGIIELNPELKFYEFYKKIDAFQTHQEIMMFISGVLGQQGKEVSKIADIDLCYSKGYDKWSFRKMGKNSK
jgi:hypothetical protein